MMNRKEFEETSGYVIRGGLYNVRKPNIIGLRFGNTPLAQYSIGRDVSDCMVLGKPSAFYISWTVSDGQWFDGPFEADGLDAMIDMASRLIVARVPILRWHLGIK